jgi:hypothetical protein
MPLFSRLFRGDPALEACLVRDSAHITPGTVGPHVPKIQKALLLIDRVVVDADEVEDMEYGASTADAVLAYKQKRNIINRSYQTQADNIVGKMTIQSLDKEMTAAQGPLRPCPCGDPVQGGSNLEFRGGQKQIAGIRGGEKQVTDTPTNLNAQLKVAYQAAVGAGKTLVGILRANRLRFALETQGRVLLAPWGMTLQPTELGSFVFPFSIDPNAPTEVQKIREVAEKAAVTQPNVLRVIFCRFDNTAQEFGVSGGPAFGGVGFLPFVLLNTLKLRLDGGTMVHEMIHTSDNAFFSNAAHDKEDQFPLSVFCSHEGRTEIRKPHAVALSKAFFAK